MSINLTREQQNAIEQAIQSGLVRSVDEFIDSAIGALAHRNGDFDKVQARLHRQVFRAELQRETHPRKHNAQPCGRNQEHC